MRELCPLCQSACWKWGKRRGNQSWYCRFCERQFTPNRVRRHLSDEHCLRIQTLRSDGASVREIIRITGHSKYTIDRYLNEPKEQPQSVIQPAHRPGVCDCCRKELTGSREADKRTARTKYRFCDMKCCSLFFRSQRIEQRCKRCGVRRGDKLCILFKRGYCERCYVILSRVRFDETLADACEAQKLLKGAVREKRHEFDR